ncbi:HAD-IIIA family hydrolase [Pelagibacteraceae bacterium]|nr:HAD-IIIA family hydrolase [Pelagibacteraceae bacterium]
MHAVILAGGDGKRIKYLTQDKQKTLLKINNKTIIRRQIDQLSKINKKIFILIKETDTSIKKNLKNIKAKKFIYLKENKKLGTAGCLEVLSNYDINNFLVIYSDILFNIDLEKFIKFHKKKKSDLTLFTHPNNHPHDSDLIEVNNSSQVVKFHKKPHKNKNFNNLCLSGIYIINKKLLKILKKNKYQDFSKDFLPKIIKNKFKVYSYRSREYVKDIGTPNRFKSGIKDFNSTKYKKGNINTKIPAIFLDKDGVLNTDRYNFKYQKPFEFIDGYLEAIKKINENGFLAILVTNQPAVAKGFITLNQLENDFKKLETILGKNGAYLDKIYFCPCHPDKGFKGEVKKFKRKCTWRKPNNGMLLRAIKDLNIDKKKSFMIGDTINDFLAAKKTGIKFLKVGKIDINRSALCFKNLKTAVNHIFKI